MSLKDVVSRYTNSSFASLASPLINQISQNMQSNNTIGQVANVYNGISTNAQFDQNGVQDVGTADNVLTNGVATNGVVGYRVIRPGDYAASVGGKIF